MRSLQDKVLDTLEKLAEKHGCELIQVADWGNSGMIYAQLKNPAFGDMQQTVLRASYDFQSGHSRIRFNTEAGKVGPPGPLAYSFAPHDDAIINQVYVEFSKLIIMSKKLRPAERVMS